MIRTFSQLAEAEAPLAGGKGRALAKLYQAGFRVPDGFVILPRAFDGDRLRDEAWAEARECVARLRGKRKDASFAVRSSALCEDSAEASFAGEFETVLDARADGDILEAIHTVRRSRHNARAEAYRLAQGIEQSERELAVVVQRMVRSEISGVLFTVDPVTGSIAQMAGNFIHGLGERLVSGQANPQTFTLSRPSGLYEGPDELRAFARALYKNASRLERTLGAPQDIEWAAAGGRLYILQSRPITTLNGYRSETSEWNDSLTGRFLWCNTNLSEQAPEVRTPFSCSFIRLHESESPHAKVYRGMRVGGYPLTGIIGGRAYSNMSVLLTANRPMMGGDARKAAKMLSATYGELPEGIDIPLIPITAREWWTKTLPGMLGYVSTMNRFKKQIPRYVTENPARCAELRGKVLKAASASELAALWQGELKPYYLHTILLVFASTIDISPRLERELKALAGAEDASALLTGLGALESLGPMAGIAKVARGEMSREAYIKAYGHRGVNEFEYAWPRPMEDPAWLDKQLADYAKSAADPEALLARQRAAHDAAWQRFAGQFPKKAKAMKIRLKRAAQVARRREAMRSEAMRTLAAIRAFALKAGELTGTGEDIFMLTIDEVCGLLTGDAAPLRFLPTRKETYARYKALPQYPSVIVGRFDPFQWAAELPRRTDFYDADAPATPHKADAVTAIKGFAGAPGVVEGIVRRLERPEDGGQLQSGEILVTSITNIGWTPLFPRAAAIVTDIGAPLSHAAIVARELGVHAVVGCGNATMVLKTGDRVRVDGGKGVVEVVG